MEGADRGDTSGIEEEPSGIEKNLERLTQQEVDVVYHVLRKASLSCDDWPAIDSLACHLFMGPKYEQLCDYLSWYGSKFIYPAFKEELDRVLNGMWSHRTFSRVADLGAGRGWLGGLLSIDYGKRTLFVDKRDLVEPSRLNYYANGSAVPNMMMELDVETDSGLDFLERELQSSDLLVMCDVLHCIDDWAELLVRLSKRCDIAILEYTSPDNPQMAESYYRQLSKYGAQPMSSTRLESAVKVMFEESVMVDRHPYSFVFCSRMPSM